MAVSLNNRPVTSKPGAVMENASALLQLVNKYSVWILVVVLVAVLSVGGVLLLQPKFQNNLDKSENYLPNKKKTYDDLAALEVKLNRLDAEFSRIKAEKQTQLDRLFSILPNAPDYASLFVQAEYLAKANRLALKSISITQPADQPLAERRPPDVTSPTASAEQQLEILPKNVRSLTVGVTLGPSSYANMKSYLAALEKNLRLYDIQTLSFDQTDEKTGSQGGYTLSLKTYFIQPFTASSTSNTITPGSRAKTK